MIENTGRMAVDKSENKSVHQIYHFGIRVSDVESWKQIVHDHQLRLYYGGEIHYPNSKSWYVHDPSGHEIEVSYTPNGRLDFPKAECVV